MVGRRSSSYHLRSDNSRTEIDVRRQFSQRRNKKCSHNNYSISPHNRSYTEGHSSFRYDGEFRGGGILWHNRKGISSKQLETSLSKSFESFFSKINIRKERLFCVPLIIHEKVFYNFKKHGSIFPSAFISSRAASWLSWGLPPDYHEYPQITELHGRSMRYVEWSARSSDQEAYLKEINFCGD